MEILHRSVNRHSKESCSYCKETLYRDGSHKAGPSRSNPKRLRNAESSCKQTLEISSLECLPNENAEHDLETSTSYSGSLSSGINEDDSAGSCPLSLRIAQPFQKANNGIIRSPCSDSAKRNNREKGSLRLRILLPKRSQVYEDEEVGQRNTAGRSDGSKVSNGPERRLELERCEGNDRTEGLDHGNCLRLRIHNCKHASKKDAHGNCSTPPLVGESVCQEGVDKSSEGIGCARIEYVHNRVERPKHSEDEAVFSQNNSCLFITYDSRRKRRHSQPLQLYVSKSRIHGQGVFTQNRMKKGVIILEFFGEVIRESVSDVREKRYLEGGMQSFYVFSLVGRERQGDKLCLDSTKKGGLGRFINHSCDPNSEAVICDGGIVIRALKDVGSGEEITLDYKMTEGKEMCWCGATKCVGVMDGSG